MAVVANVVSQQSLQFDVPGIAPAGATRVFMTTGIAQVATPVQDSPNKLASQSTGVKLLVEPVIAPGQFRRATAVVALAASAGQMAMRPDRSPRTSARESTTSQRVDNRVRESGDSDST